MAKSEKYLILYLSCILILQYLILKKFALELIIKVKIKTTTIDKFLLFYINDE